MRYIRLAYLSVSTFAVVLMLNGCGVTSNHMGSAPAPAVENIGVQTNGVAPNRWQYVQFNEAMDPSTINSQTIMVKDGGGTPVAGTVTYDTTFDVAGFRPNPPLADNASYSLTVSTGVASAQGAHFASPYTYSFTTRASTDKSPIYVKSVTPAPNATCVSTGTPITIKFSEGAEISTLNANDIVITGPGSMSIPAQMSYNVGNATVTLTPGSSLPSGSITVTVRNVADAAGVAMTSAYAWSFSTACSGSGGSASTQYQTPLLNEKGLNTVKGEVTIDTAGSTMVQLTGVAASTNYFVQFCPAIDTLSQNATAPCFAILNVITDASGNGNSTIKFPQSGDWAGDFYVSVNGSSSASFQTSLAQGLNNETYTAVLLPKTKTNGGADTSITKQDPLASGEVTYANGSLKFTVAGAAPSASYGTNESETNYVDSSGTYGLSTFTTDSTGNGTSTTTLNGGLGGDLFQVVLNDGSAAGFIGGFTIPM